MLEHEFPYNFDQDDEADAADTAMMTMNVKQRSEALLPHHILRLTDFLQLRETLDSPLVLLKYDDVQIVKILVDAQIYYLIVNGSSGNGKSHILKALMQAAKGASPIPTEDGLVEYDPLRAQLEKELDRQTKNTEYWKVTDLDWEQCDWWTISALLDSERRETMQFLRDSQRNILLGIEMPAIGEIPQGVKQVRKDRGLLALKHWAKTRNKNLVNIFVIGSPEIRKLAKIQRDLAYLFLRLTTPEDIERTIHIMESRSVKVRDALMEIDPTQKSWGRLLHNLLLELGRMGSPTAIDQLWDELLTDASVTTQALKRTPAVYDSLRAQLEPVIEAHGDINTEKDQEETLGIAIHALNRMRTLKLKHGYVAINSYSAANKSPLLSGLVR